LAFRQQFNKYATNPCPCGFYNHPEKECVCGAGVITRYLNKISGPLPSSDEAFFDLRSVAKSIAKVDRPHPEGGQNGCRPGGSEEIRIEDLV
jgi:predicted ATPase with chaperone activity